MRTLKLHSRNIVPASGCCLFPLRGRDAVPVPRIRGFLLAQISAGFCGKVEEGGGEEGGDGVGGVAVAGLGGVLVEGLLEDWK
jgi:hypothetical protein